MEVFVKPSRSNVPRTALIADPSSVPIFPAPSKTGNSSTGKESALRNSAMVKPIPPRQAPPKKIGQLTPLGNLVQPNLTATKQNKKIPNGLPITSPMATAMETPLVSATGSSTTPALA